MLKIHEETMCCGYRKCVNVEVFDDGSVTLSDNDAEAGSVGTIKLRPEVAARLLELLSKPGSTIRPSVVIDRLKRRRITS